VPGPGVGATPGAEPRRELPFGGQSFSLLRPRIEAPPLPGPTRPEAGGAAPDGEGEGLAGRGRDGQAAIPLNTPDPRYADYFKEIKKRLEANWVYPSEAVRRRQAGQLVAEIVVRRDGTVPRVDLVNSSGIEVLDRYALNAVRFASPFPAIPDRIGLDKIPITITFTYVLDHGVRVFGLR
jgi:protein TonB